MFRAVFIVLLCSWQWPWCTDAINTTIMSVIPDRKRSGHSVFWLTSSEFTLCLCPVRMRQGVNWVVVETLPCQRAPQTVGWGWRTKRSLCYLEQCPENSLLWHRSVPEKVWPTDLRTMVGVFKNFVTLKRKSSAHISSASVSLCPAQDCCSRTAQCRSVKSPVRYWRSSWTRASSQWDRPEGGAAGLERPTASWWVLHAHWSMWEKTDSPIIYPAVKARPLCETLTDAPEEIKENHNIYKVIIVIIYNK